MITYRINKSEILDEDHIGHDTYGISVFDGEIETHTIKDVSLNYAKITDLIELCNKYELSPLHIFDVVDDFLAIV